MHLGIIKITYNRTAMQFMDGRFMNLGEEVILTLLWQSGISESATVFVISLSICYWLFKCWVLRVVCVCVCERERERGGGVTAQHCVCMCVCACKRERWSQCSVVCVCVLACVRERETHGHITTVACVQTHTSFITVSVKWLCFPSLAWTDGKTKDIINCLYNYCES